MVTPPTKTYYKDYLANGSISIVVRWSQFPIKCGDNGIHGTRPQVQVDSAHVLASVTPFTTLVKDNGVKTPRDCSPQASVIRLIHCLGGKLITGELVD